MKEILKKSLRKITKAKFFEPLLVKLSQGHDEYHPFVRLVPRHTQYNEKDVRKVTRNEINYELTLNNYNDFLVYYGIDNQNKGKIYELVQEDFHVFDVGTNIGEVILNIAKRAKKGVVHGFEPVPYNYKKVSKNISLNDFDNIILNNIALSDRDETVFFDDEELKSHSGLISMNKNKILNSKEVKAITFDGYVSANNIQRIDFIKVDIEGFELNFLRGAEQSIKKFKPILFMEIDDANLKKQFTSASELIAWIEDLGFYQIKDVYGKSVRSCDNFIGEHFDVICKPL